MIWRSSSNNPRSDDSLALSGRMSTLHDLAGFASWREAIPLQRLLQFPLLRENGTLKSHQPKTPISSALQPASLASCGLRRPTATYQVKKNVRLGLWFSMKETQQKHEIRLGSIWLFILATSDIIKSILPTEVTRTYASWRNYWKTTSNT